MIRTVVAYLFAALTAVLVLLIAADRAARAEGSCPSIDFHLEVVREIGGSARMMAADELARAAEIFRALSYRAPPPWSVGFLVELPGGAGSVLLGFNTSICGQIFAVPARWPALRLTIQSGGA